MARQNLPPSMRPARQVVSGMTLESRLGRAAVLAVHYTAHILKLDRDAAISQVVRDAQDGFDPARSKLKYADVGGDRVQVVNTAHIFNMTYAEHRHELGDPVTDRNQERCLAIVRRTLEALPNLDGGLSQFDNLPDVILI